MLIDEQGNKLDKVPSPNISPLITDDEKKAEKAKIIMPEIRAFLQGATYCWCKNHNAKPFVLHNLVASNWGGTPLDALYWKHRNMGKDNDAANDQAGKEAGKILKSVLYEDTRDFELIDEYNNTYSWMKKGAEG